MKTVLLAFTALILTSMAMGQNSIELPAPVKTGGMPLMEALSKRATDRLMDPARSLDEQQLSNLLWAAWGINRPDGRRTAPSALNRQEIDIYLIAAATRTATMRPDTNWSAWPRATSAGTSTRRTTRKHATGFWSMSPTTRKWRAVAIPTGRHRPASMPRTIAQNV